jgi:hypothetical protein
MSPTPDEYTWRYLQRGRVRHILAQASGIDAAAVAIVPAADAWEVSS